MASVGDSISWNSSAGGAWANSGAVFYKVIAVNSTEITIRAEVDGSASQSTTLKFVVSTSTWDDTVQPSDAPHQLTSSNTWANTTTTQTSDKLYVWNGNNSLLGALEIPSWGQASTNTEGSSYSGTLTVNGTSLEYEIPATSSSGTYELKADGTTQLPIVHGSTASTGSAPNFDQTKIWTLISPTGDELDEIDLTGSSSTRNVFCNFW